MTMASRRKPLRSDMGDLRIPNDTIISALHTLIHDTAA
jgi:hypothetical protein